MSASDEQGRDRDASRLQEYLTKAEELYPGAMKRAAQAHARQGQGNLPILPRYCFFPVGGWVTFLRLKYETERIAVSQAEIVHEALLLSALGGWRMTKGIYRIDPALAEALVRTPMEGEIPIEALQRLPERCVYVEMPFELTGVGGRQGGCRAYGFFAYLDPGDGDGLDLCLVADTELGLKAAPVWLRRSDSLQEAIQRRLELMPDSEKRDGLERATLSDVGRMLSILLYLCAENAEIGDGARRPSNPAIVQARRGERLCAARNATTWNVGVRIGSALRRKRAEDETALHGQEHAGEAGERAKPRAHIRRAHWHGVRVGPMRNSDGTAIPREERAFRLQWWPPTPIAMGDPDELPAVVRQVGGDPDDVQQTPMEARVWR